MRRLTMWLRWHYVRREGEECAVDDMGICDEGYVGIFVYSVSVHVSVVWREEVAEECYMKDIYVLERLFSVELYIFIYVFGC